METFILVLHVIIALAIIGLIMLQQGKGAEMGASFGSGSSQTIFGAVGTGNLFSRLTAIFVAVFFITSSSLAVMSKHKSKID
ncbi:MAG: preprotein translocase subunit SecG, partial [Moraxellaceae bacterium]